MSLQNALSNMQNGLTKDTTADNATVVSQVNVGPIKPVDRLTLEGSTPGDFRSQAAPAVLPNQPNPREAVGQFRDNSRLPNGPAPVTTVDSENVGG